LRLINDKKGQVRVIEAFFASILLLSCLTLVPAQVNSKGSSDNLLSTAENVLLSLDSNGKLGLMADSADWSGLKNCVESALPLTVWFNLTVFDKDMNALNEFPICNAGAVSEQIVSVQYVCASQNSQYNIYILQLQLAVMD
jgi:hypothetical protein